MKDLNYEEPLTSHIIRTMIPDGELRYMYRAMFWDYNEYTIDGKINWDIIFYRIAFFVKDYKISTLNRKKTNRKILFDF